MQTTEEKVDTSKALDASSVDTECSRTVSKEHDTSSKSGNDAHDDDADIRPIYDEEPMAEVQMTAEIDVFSIGQQHTEQPEFSNEGEKVAKLLKENETLKKNYKELFDSIKITRAMTIEHTTSLTATNDKFKAQLQEKGFAIATLKNKLRKSTGNSVNTKFAKSSILGKPMSQPLRNQSVVRQPTAFKSERPRFSKPREAASAKPHHMIASSNSRINSKNMPRFTSNDMVHNHYLEEAKKKIQKCSRNSKPSLMPSARSKSTANGSKPMPRRNTQTSRNWPASKNSFVTTKNVPIAEHTRNSRNFLTPNILFARHVRNVSLVQIMILVSELGLHDHNNEPSSSKLVPNIVPLACKTATTRQALELLFHHHITMLSSEFGLHDHNNEPSSSKLVPNVVPLACKTATTRQALELLFHHHITMLRKPRRKVTKVPQLSDHIEHVADEAVYEGIYDSLVRDTTNASSLEAEQDSARVHSSKDEPSLGEDASKQGRKIDDIDDDEGITLVDETTKNQGRFSDQEDVEILFDVTDDLREGWKSNILKNKPFANIQELFDKAMKRVNTFIDYTTELVEESSKKAEAEVMEGSSKRADTELEQESSKKQKIDEDKETTKPKQLVKITPDEGVAINAIPLAVKPPSIVDWKIHKEGKKSYYQIIRVDGSSMMYLVFNHMLKSFNREDVKTLWKLVKAKNESTRLEKGYERVIWGDLKVMFDPRVEDEV
nr:hypothetical protein [Tanacetum cinerariifolium]